MLTKRDKVSALYDALKAQKDRKRAAAPTVRELAPAERRAYQAEAARASRARATAERSSIETPRPTRANIRAALADAAIMLLATDGPGSAEVRAALATAFGQPGLPLRLAAQARSGELQPRLLTPARLRGGADPEGVADERPARIRSRRGL